MSSLQNSLAIVGVLTLVGVVIFNLWTARQNAPRQAAPETTAGVDPVLDHSDLGRSGLNDSAYLDDEISILPTPDKKPPLDALIDVIAAIEVDVQVSGDAALAALPSTRRVGTKPFAVEGLNDNSGEWETPVAGRRYHAFQAGVQLANRVGPLNEIEFSEYVIKAQNFADSIGGAPEFSDMLEEVARARELDQFASAHDAQLSFTVTSAAWSPGYIHQHAARWGFVAGVIPGRMVLAAPVQGLPPILSLSFDTQAAMADDPALSAIKEFTLSLDVPQVPREEQAFARLREAARILAGHALTEANLNAIAVDLELLYDALDSRELSAGSPQARRLFS
ncbi:MAG: hypothetical protein RI994_856 [Pseudomonadota bacterium]